MPYAQVEDKVFIGSIRDAEARINAIYRDLSYDHRPFLDNRDEQLAEKMTERYRVEYACFKQAVARVIHPDRIVEIGVGSGVSALAFAAALPDLHYTGLDIGEWDKRLEHHFVAAVENKLAALRISHQIILGDSQSIDVFPYCDLVHVDGDHSTAATRHDVAAAWRSGTPWILVDDARDPAVCEGIFAALRRDINRGDADWAYFPSWTGNILIRTDHRRADL